MHDSRECSRLRRMMGSTGRLRSRQDGPDSGQSWVGLGFRLGARIGQLAFEFKLKGTLQFKFHIILNKKLNPNQIQLNKVEPIKIQITPNIFTLTINILNSKINLITRNFGEQNTHLSGLNYSITTKSLKFTFF